MQQSNVRELTQMSMCVALCCVTAYISFPLPFTPGMVTALTFALSLTAYILPPRQTLMVMIVQLGNPIGIILGYGMGMICDSFAPDDYSGWRLSFGLEGVILVICAFITLEFILSYLHIQNINQYRYWVADGFF